MTAISRYYMYGLNKHIVGDIIGKMKFFKNCPNLHNLNMDLETVKNVKYNNSLEMSHKLNTAGKQCVGVFLSKSWQLVAQ